MARVVSMVRPPVVLLVLLAASAPVPAAAQIGEVMDRYDALYGTPVDVTLDDLATGASAYRGRAIRTKGRLELYMGTGGGARRDYQLRGQMHSAIVVPVPDIQTEFEQEGLKMMGSEVELTGVVFEVGGDEMLRNPSAPTVGIQFWRYLGPPERDTGKEIEAPAVTLESLVGKPGSRDGQTVRVVGKFRGRNLYGDLPAASQRATADWVIKDDLFAVWISGRKPKGPGFDLDAGLKRDTGKWIEVIGRPETRGGVTYIRALRVSLSAPPTPTADVKPPPPPPERPQKPPVVVFALPLDGELDVPTTGQFVVQFSKDMDEKTFDGHVLLRYTGPRVAGDREFAGLKLFYDRGRRALTVDPGDVLRPRRQVELVLLEGIADIDGLPLAPRAGKMFLNAVDVLKFVTEG
jgi:hypothetical protein